MSTRPNMIFEAFVKSSGMSPTLPALATKPDGAGDSMQKLRTGSSKPSWTAPNPTQATPSDNPIAAQKIAPAPPVQ